MPICPICDDTGLQNSDSEHPQFCFCSAGKSAKRAWEKGLGPKVRPTNPASFIDISSLDEVNASVDAMRASLLGTVSSEQGTTRSGAVKLLFQVAHAGHEVSIQEATQLYDLAKALEGFLSGIAPLGRTKL